MRRQRRRRTSALRAPLALAVVLFAAATIVASPQPAAALSLDLESRFKALQQRLFAGQEAAASVTAAAAAAASTSPPPQLSAPPRGARPLAAAVVFRHGARTPLSAAFYGDVEWGGASCGDEAYAGPRLILHNAAPGAPPGAPPPPVIDEDVPALPGGCREGTLTARGFEMATALGARLRRRYVGALRLLPRDFEAGAVAAHTTMYRRTIATLRVRCAV